MCLAIPAKINHIKNDTALVDIDGIKKRVSLLLMADLKVGDYVIVHAGFVIQKISESEARTSIELVRQLTSLPSKEA